MVKGKVQCQETCFGDFNFTAAKDDLKQPKFPIMDDFEKEQLIQAYQKGKLKFVILATREFPEGTSTDFWEVLKRSLFNET